MMRAFFALAVLVPVGHGIAQPAPPAFEVASVKPSRAKDESSTWHSRTGYLVMHNQTLKAMVGIAYHVKDDQISKGPKWFDSDRFDVEARAAGPAQNPELIAMLQTLLAERFQLAFHRQQKFVSGYKLVVAKNGLKIHADETAGKSRSNSGRGRMAVERISMPKLAESLSRVVGSPVEDETHTEGLFSFTLEWSPDSPHSAPAADGTPLEPLGPSLFTVLQQQLGVKLEPAKVPVDVLVIERAEKPSEN